MQKRILALLAGMAMALPAAAQIGAPGATDWVKTLQPQAPSPFPPMVPAGRADDYVSIVNLMSTYFVALDAGDLDTYAGVFAPDATLYWIGGVEHGRDAIYKNLASFGTGRQKLPKDATDRPRFIHTLGSQRIDFTGPNTAHDVGMWLGFSNRNDHKFETAEFGHYEDKYVKIDGRWYFQERRIFNERLSNRGIYYPELGERDPREK
ncbi:nuclear transport factor 2 family protein [Sphingomonas sp. MMS24-J13]|uniref:nuclear transport factor 2 family protein n=1 Tax=Sphingomonas sp. MMS24-J13 TaxID=3238686 RepID=UPI00384A6985